MNANINLNSLLNGPQEVSIDVLIEKYAKGDELTVESIQLRVAKAIAANEKNPAKFQKIFLKAMQDGYIPAGRTMSAAGAGIQQPTLINCFVQPIADKISAESPDDEAGIYDALREAAETMRRGGGVGYNFSSLRPKNAKVKGTSSHASGPLSYMRVFDRSCETVESAGARRGAQMGVLNCFHPDIMEFITAKAGGDLRNFNISVGVTDQFMRAVETNSDFELFHKAEPSIISEGVYQRADGMWVYKTVKASEVWEAIMKNTYNAAEPGVLYLDRINAHNNLSYIEIIEATNPCGEQPLPAYGCCCLGSVNLTKFIVNPFTDLAFFDEDLFKQVVRTAVRMLDSVLDITVWPLKAQGQEAANKRRVGLGFTGLGDALIMMGLKYNSPEARQMSAFWTELMFITAYDASSDLALEKGAFPLFDADKYLSGDHTVMSLPGWLIDKIRKQGIRNSHLISIAPTGTISLAFGDNCSNGIEPAFSWTYDRTKRMPDGSKKVYAVEDHAYRVYRSLGGDIDNLPEAFVSALTISANDHLQMVAAVAPYVDSAISKTVNVPADYDYEDFKDLYMNAWKAGLKGITTYRPNDITGSVLSVTPEPSASQPTTKLVEVDPKLKFNVVPTPALGSLKWRKRPTLNEGNPSWTYLSVGNGFSFSTVVGSIDGDMSPFEVWVMGAEAPRGLGALAKTLSMDMRCKDRNFLKLKLDSISEMQGFIPFTYDMPNGTTRNFTNPVALFASLVSHRCVQLGAYDDLDSYKPLIDSMISENETFTSTNGAMAWQVDVKNPVTNDHFAMIIKEGELPNGKRMPYGVSLSDGFDPSLLGLTKSLSLDMRVLDPAWIGAKLRQLSDFIEPQGNFFAKMPGSDKQVNYPSTVAYMVALIMHRYQMLGILDENGFPVEELGMLSFVDDEVLEIKPAVETKFNKVIPGKQCIECRQHSVFKSGGCEQCSACGWIGSCG